MQRKTFYRVVLFGVFFFSKNKTIREFLETSYVRINNFKSFFILFASSCRVDFDKNLKQLLKNYKVRDNFRNGDIN